MRWYFIVVATFQRFISSLLQTFPLAKCCEVNQTGLKPGRWSSGASDCNDIQSFEGVFLSKESVASHNLVCSFVQIADLFLCWTQLSLN